MTSADRAGDAGAGGGEALAGALSGALEDLLRWARRMPPPGGVSLPAMALLSRLSADGPAGVSALAAAEHVSQPSVSQMVDRLERAGLVVRAVGHADRRAVTVSVTAAGCDLLARRRRARALAIEDLLAVAGPGDAEVLSAAAPALARLVTAAAGSPPPPPVQPCRPTSTGEHP